MDPTLAVILSAALACLGTIAVGRMTNRTARSGQVLLWAAELQKSEAAARKEAQEARERAQRVKDETESEIEELQTEFEGLKTELRQTRRMAEECNDILAQVRAEVWRPEPNIEALRRVVGRPNGLNGR